jgi:RNA polymerase sigma-70 factor (ECF subfamily)
VEEDHDRLGERTLVLRSQLGDEAAFEALFDRYHTHVLYYLQGIVGRAEAEDVLQKVWLAVYRKIGGLRRPETFRSWLYRIARNTAISRLRKRRGRVPLESAPVHEELVVDPDVDKDDDLVAVDVEALRAALERLSEDHREAIVLRYVEEMSYREIAEVVDAPVGTVRSRLYYAKKALAEAVADYDDD